MKNTPSALKWLAEKRARIAFELQTKRQIHNDLERQIAALQVDLASLDRSITIFDSRIDPNGIAPVNGWKGRYGKRGALKEAVSALIQEAAPHSISTGNLEVLVCLKFGIAFATKEERIRWRKGGLRAALRHLSKDGLIELDDTPCDSEDQFRYWRWKHQAHSFDALKRTIATKADLSSAPPAP